MNIADEKYVSLTTFRKNGDAVATPVWIVPVGDNEAGFWTSSTSGKVKRIRNTSLVTLQPSDSRGRVTAGSAVVEGTARLVDSGTTFDEIGRKVKAKYGFMVPVSKLFAKISALVKRRKQPYGDVAVVITLP
jgi:hypothetical protein